MCSFRVRFLSGSVSADGLIRAKVTCALINSAHCPLYRHSIIDDHSHYFLLPQETIESMRSLLLLLLLLLLRAVPVIDNATTVQEPAGAIIAGDVGQQEDRCSDYR